MKFKELLNESIIGKVKVPNNIKKISKIFPFGNKDYDKGDDKIYTKNNIRYWEYKKEPFLARNGDILQIDLRSAGFKKNKNIMSRIQSVFDLVPTDINVKKQWDNYEILFNSKKDIGVAFDPFQKINLRTGIIVK